MTSGTLARTRRLTTRLALCTALVVCDSTIAGDQPTTGPSGRLWHNHYALDYISGTQVANLDNSASALVAPEKFAQPWNDGTQYIVTDYRASPRGTTITVRETSTRRTIFKLRYSGYATAARPSPASKDVVLLTVSSSVAKPADYAFVNLRTQSFIDRFAEGKVSIDWLPDGRFLQLDTQGRLSIGTPGGEVAPIGSFDLQSRRLGNLRVNPQGTQFVVTLIDTSGVVTKPDLWLANIDGSNPSRLTSTNISTYGHWSPDGRYVAFNADTGTTCTGDGCLGTCELWYAPSTARNLKLLPASPGAAAQFRVRHQRGGTSVLGCGLLAWVR